MLDIIAWMATFFAFSAYVGVSLGFLDNKSKLFLVSMLFSSVGFILHALNINNYSAVVQNLFFFTFAFLGLINIYINFSWFNKKSLYFLTIFSVLASCLYYEFHQTEWIFYVMGWPAVCIIVGAFVLYAQCLIDNKEYLQLNVLGNVFLSIHLIYFENYPFAALQVFAFFMGAYGLKKIKRNQLSPPNI